MCDETDPADLLDTVDTNILEQAEIACRRIKSNHLLMDEINNIGSYSLYGVSQGALIAR